MPPLLPLLPVVRAGFFSLVRQPSPASARPPRAV